MKKPYLRNATDDRTEDRYVQTERTPHDLKVLTVFFEPLSDGRKPFEIRKNDRDFKVGDWLCLREWDEKTQSYSGWETLRKITYILDNEEYLQSGYVCLGLGVEVVL